MEMRIPILAPGIKADMLISVLQVVPERELGMQFLYAQPQPSTLRSSSEVVLAVVELLKVTLPAVIGMIGVMWAAHIKKAINRKRAAAKRNEPVVRLEVEGRPDSITIEVGSLSDNEIAESVAKFTSDRQVTRILLEVD